MLEAMTPDQFRERYAHWMIEQWGDDWKKFGTVAAVVQNVAAIMLFKQTAEPIPMMTPDQFKPTVTLSDAATDTPQPDRYGLSDDESLAYFERQAAS